MRSDPCCLMCCFDTLAIDCDTFEIRERRQCCDMSTSRCMPFEIVYSQKKSSISGRPRCQTLGRAVHGLRAQKAVVKTLLLMSHMCSPDLESPSSWRGSHLTLRLLCSWTTRGSCWPRERLSRGLAYPTYSSDRPTLTLSGEVGTQRRQRTWGGRYGEVGTAENLGRGAQ